MLEHALGEVNGKWAAFEVGLVVPRQNGKGAILEARELAGLFLFGERLILHTSHEFKTSADHFRRMSTLIQSNPDLDSHVAKMAGSHGSEGIELRTSHVRAGIRCDLCNGQRLKFIARTGGSGRGFYGDLVVCDEAYNLGASAMSALIPTLTTSPNPQVWFTSSSVNQEIHPNGQVLARVRRRGMSGQATRLCFLEWSVDEDEFNAHPDKIIADPRSWAQANPALGTSRLTHTYVADEMGALSVQGFAVERLGVGDWPNEDEGEQVIPMDVWSRLVAKPSSVEAPLVFAIDMPPQRNTASFASCRNLPTGPKFVEVLPPPRNVPRGTGWVVTQARRLHEKWKPSAWMVDRMGPAATLVEELAKPYYSGIDRQPEVIDPRHPNYRPGLPVQVTDGTEMAVACGSFYDDAMAGALRHGDQRALNMALRAATTRKLLDRWAWSRKGVTDISPLVAATIARYGLVKYGKVKMIATPVIETTASSGGLTDDLLNTAF